MKTGSLVCLIKQLNFTVKLAALVFKVASILCHDTFSLLISHTHSLVIKLSELHMNDRFTLFRRGAHSLLASVVDSRECRCSPAATCHGESRWCCRAPALSLFVGPGFACTYPPSRSLVNPD